ncbi:hypothetical protein Lal_00014163 [Lupinus albus]|nr:hypothetical protein Lal_00014163 [Lupinus albus]
MASLLGKVLENLNIFMTSSTHLLSNPKLEITLRRNKKKAKAKAKHSKQGDKADFSSTPTTSTILEHEDPYKHLTKFYEMVGTVGIAENEEETIFLRLFPLTLIGKAKEWFLDLLPHIQADPNHVEEKFLTRYFPQGKMMHLKTSISVFIQAGSESLSEP